MTVEAARYWGEVDGQWQLGGLTATLTRYPALQPQRRHRHENPTYFFLLDGAFSDQSTELGYRLPERFELLYHPAGAWHEGISGPEGRYGLNLEIALEELDLREGDLGEYRLENDPMRCTELLRLILLGLETLDDADPLMEVLLAPQKRKEAPCWLRRLDSLLDAPADQTWTLRTLADELAVHPVYLARIFRARHGCSVSDWLLRRRLLAAAKGLADGRSASDVAHETGFADQSHFGRAFRAYAGQTPSAFRRRWRK